MILIGATVNIDTVTGGVKRSHTNQTINQMLNPINGNETNSLMRSIVIRVVMNEYRRSGAKPDQRGSRWVRQSCIHCQQNSWRHLMHSMCLHPSFFSMLALQLGHSFVHIDFHTVDMASSRNVRTQLIIAVS
jgi:hypothetical protein